MQGRGRRGTRRYYTATAALSILVGATTKYAFDIPHPILAIKQPEAVQDVDCREVRTRARSTCYRDITTKERYSCSQPQRNKSCGQTRDACTKKALTNGASRCQRARLVRQCRSIAGTCYRRETQLREYPCLGREICTVVPTEVQRACVRNSINREAYPCEKHKVDRICTDVQVPVDKVCHREEARTVQYLCKKTEYKRACQPMVAEALSTEICFRTVMHTEEYACTRTEMKKTCSRQPVEVRGQCTRVVPRERPYACTRRVVHQRCRNGIMKKKPSMCSRTVKIQQPYDCGERQFRAECAVEPTCKDKKCKMRRLQPASCQTASVARSKTCYREVDVVQEYPCATPANAEGCETVEEEIAATCTKVTNREEKYTCIEKEYKEICEEVPVEVPATCQKEVPVQEAYPCPAPQVKKIACEHQPIEVEDTCQKQVMVQVPYSCSETETKTECKNARVTYQGTCYRTVPKKE